MLAQTKTYPVYVLRDSAVAAASVPKAVSGALTSWAHIASLLPQSMQSSVIHSGPSVQAEFSEGGELYPAPFYVDQFTLEVVDAKKFPDSFALILLMGTDVYSIGVDADLKGMARTAHKRPSAVEEPTPSDITKGCLDVHSLFKSVLTAAATYPKMRFREVDSHRNPMSNQLMIINVG